MEENKDEWSTVEDEDEVKDEFTNEWSREEWILDNHGKEIYDEYKERKSKKGLSNNDEITKYESGEILRAILKEKYEEENESKNKRRNMTAIHIGIRHNNQLMIAKAGSV